MSTTIQVSGTTRQMLEMVKNRMGAASFEETLHKMLEDKLGTPKSMFGVLKGKMRPFTREERLEMWKS